MTWVLERRGFGGGELDEVRAQGVQRAAWDGLKWGVRVLWEGQRGWGVLSERWLRGARGQIITRSSKDMERT